MNARNAEGALSSIDAGCKTRGMCCVLHTLGVIHSIEPGGESTWMTLEHRGVTWGYEGGGGEIVEV